MAKFSAVVRTNLTPDRCKERFLVSLSKYISEKFDICEKNVILELHTNVTLLRDGTTKEAMNLDIHHNSEKVNKSTKKCLAEDMAEYIHQELDIAKERVLVLFFNTGKCT